MRVMSTKIRIAPGKPQWAAYFYVGNHKYVMRRLTDKKGPIVPSKGVERIEDEIEPIRTKATDAAYSWSNKLGEMGEYANNRWSYNEAVKKYIEWHVKYRNNPKIKSHAKRSLREFNKKKIALLKRKEVQNWIDGMVKEGLSHNTIKHTVNVGKACFNWMKREGHWQGSNPFEHHEWKARGRGHEIKQTISREEFELILKLSEPYLQATQAVMIAYYSGLRPTEIYRVQPEDFNHRDLTMTVRVKKTGDFQRLIVIPAQLSEWARSFNLVRLNGNTIMHRMTLIAKQHPSLTGLCMDSFRHNYAHQMELAGASHESIDAHMGHGKEATTLKKNYLKDRMRAVNLMRSYVVSVYHSSTIPKLVEQKSVAAYE